jgi:PTH1 family peptidyl-tRNA hydrolase
VESKLDTFHFFLLKPATFVNNSGLAVKEIVDELMLDLSEILVIYDDINLATGELRIRKSGGDGGHNGIKSIFYHLNENNFTRLRIGISKNNEDDDLADYVLSEFTKTEVETIKLKVPFIHELMEYFIIGGTQEMLNHFSKKSQINS